MRFMMMIKSDEATDSGKLPSEEELAAMGKFNEQLVNAGVLLAGEGLHDSGKGARLSLTKEGATVTDGPFTEAKELVAGFWILQVKSKEEALEWARRVPAPPEGEVRLEIRQVFEVEDFGEAATPEIREHEQELRARSATQQS